MYGLLSIAGTVLEDAMEKNPSITPNEDGVEDIPDDDSTDTPEVVAELYAIPQLTSLKRAFR